MYGALLLWVHRMLARLALIVLYARDVHVSHMSMSPRSKRLDSGP
jgi:hypothetical protein